MIVKRSKRDINREIRHLASGESCKKALGKIYAGMEVFGLTNGQFSVISIIEHIIAQTGPVDVDIATWTVASAEILKIKNFLKYKKIKKVRFLIDAGFPTRQREYFELLIFTFGKEILRLARSHCKIVTIRNEKWNIAIRTSMNLNENTRIENFEISDCAMLCNYLSEIFDSFFSKPLDYRGPLLGELKNAQTEKNELDIDIDLSLDLDLDLEI